MNSNNDLFLKNLLILVIVIIIYTYVRQQKIKAKLLNNFNNTNKLVNSNDLKLNIKKLETTILNKLANINNLKKPKDINKNNLVEFTNGKTYLGPEHNFHQTFNNQHKKVLGWRKWWFNNQNNCDLINKTDQFQPKMRNFFNNQENTKNIYLNN